MEIDKIKKETDECKMCKKRKNKRYIKIIIQDNHIFECRNHLHLLKQTLGQHSSPPNIPNICIRFHPYR